MNSIVPTPEEFAEWRYRIDERLAILLDGSRVVPTDEQNTIARREADAYLEQYRAETEGYAWPPFIA